MLPVSARQAVVGLVVVALFLFAHAGALDNGFHYDDIHSVVENLELRSIADPLAFFTDPSTFSVRPERAMFRPLVVLSYALTYSLASLESWAYLLGNLLTHAACAGCVFALARALRLAPMQAAAAALLFALHPVNSEVVNYVSSRSESFAALGVFVALWAYLRWRIVGGAVLYCVSVATFAQALLCKATAIVVPAMLLNIEASFSQRRRLLVVVPFVAVGLAYVWFVAQFALRALGDPVRPLAYQIWTQLKAMPYYASLLVVPTGLSVEHDFVVAETIADPVVVLCLVLLASVVLLMWRSAGPRLRLLGGWTVLALTPSSLVPLNVLVNEHRLYVAGGCLAIGAVGFLTHLQRHRQHRMMTVAGVLLLLILTVLSRQQSEVWNSELKLWTNAVERAPNAYRAYMHLGGAQEAEGSVVAALDSYRQATRLGSDVAETHYNLGNALRLTRHPAQARQAWERSLQLDPTFVDALLNLAASYQEAGDWKQTWALLNRAEAAHPHSPEVWRRKGVAFFRGNDDVERARTAYLRALELDPTSAETHYNLGNLYHRERRFGDADRQYSLALRYNGAHHGAAYNLAELKLSAMGQAEAAEQICRQMLALESLRHTPGETKFFYLLARALDAQGKTVEARTNYRIFLRFRAAQAPLLEWVQNRIEQLKASHR